MDRALTWNERVFFLRPLQDGGRIMFLAEKNVIKTIQKIQTSSKFTEISVSRTSLFKMCVYRDTSHYANTGRFLKIINQILVLT